MRMLPSGCLHWSLAEMRELLLNHAGWKVKKKSGHRRGSFLDFLSDRTHEELATTNKCSRVQLRYHSQSALAESIRVSPNYRTDGSQVSMKWLLQNFVERMHFALRNPRYALGALYRALPLSTEGFLST